MARDGKDAFYRTLHLGKDDMKLIRFFRDVSNDMKKNINKPIIDEEKDKEDV